METLNAKAWHQREHATLRIAHAKLEARSRALGRARLACVVVTLGSLAAIGLQLVAPRAAWLALASAVTFVVLAVIHARVDRERDRRDAGALFHERALARLLGTLQKEPAPFITIDDLDKHPYAKDLDIVGPQSIETYVSFARTDPGVRTLTVWLLQAHDPPAPETIRARQDAARTLSKNPTLARALWVAGSPIAEQRDRAHAFEHWLLSKDEADPLARGVLGAVIAWVLPIAAITSLALGTVLGWPSEATYAPCALAIVASLAMRARIGRAAEAVVAHQGGALAFASACEVAVNAKLEGEMLASIARDLDGARAALRALRAPTVALESIQNDLLRIFVAPIFMVELHAVRALERWRAKHAARAEAWFDAYGALESLASFGLLAHDFPDYAWPEIVGEKRFEATALGHPLVAPDKRVCNDIAPLVEGHAIVVTGSNMSGKSTLLRSIGVACALAQAGGPVCAERLTIGPLRLATSMRVSDSLTEGASRFFAELVRLKLVVDMASRGPGVLFLLDEVLYGTNARERLIGSRATLAWLLDHGALGAVSTHDLALADLDASGSLESRARNVHFEEQVTGDEMTFDYKLRDGVVQSSNALRLMRKLGLPVGDEGA